MNELEQQNQRLKESLREMWLLASNANRYDSIGREETENQIERARKLINNEAFDNISSQVVHSASIEIAVMQLKYIASMKGTVYLQTENPSEQRKANDALRQLFDILNKL